MGSTLSPVIVDFALTKLENEVIPSLDYSISIYYGYIDNFLLGISTDKVESR